ncbi:hypothetical protein ACIBSV_49385 [Embleya sp. NPDC050154]|uniref:hypothetical protein n=1 Tax=unclassified Embleya TaxID=2699296 RepID=UPI003794CE45
MATVRSAASDETKVGSRRTEDGAVVVVERGVEAEFVDRDWAARFTRATRS